MNKKKLIVIGGVVLGAVILFVAAVLLFLKFRAASDEESQPIEAGLGLDAGEDTEQATSETPLENESTAPPVYSTPPTADPSAIRQASKGLWEIPAPFDFKELSKIREALDRERQDIRRTRDQLKAEKSEMSRLRSDLEERERHVDSQIELLQTLTEELERAHEANDVRMKLLDQEDEKAIESLAKTYSQLKEKSAAEALKNFANEEDALKILMKLEPKKRAKILQQLDGATMAEWSEKIKELELLELSTRKAPEE